MRLVRVVLAVTVLLAVGMSAAFAQTPAKRIVTPDLPKRPPEATYVVPFLNGSGSQGLEWMRVAIAGAMVEKLEVHPGLRLLNPDTLVAEGLPPTVDDAGVAAFAKRIGARWVFTGSFSKPNWKLAFSVRLWSIENGVATLVGEKKQKGEFA